MGKRYGKEFKNEAVRIASESGNSKEGIKRDFGMGQGVVNGWKHELRKGGEKAFSGKSQIRFSDEELTQLKHGVERLRRERDIFKKDGDIFSQHPGILTGSWSSTALFGVRRGVTDAFGVS